MEAKPEAKAARKTLFDELTRVNSRKPAISAELLKILKLSIRLRRIRPRFIRIYNKEHKIRLEDSPWRKPKGIDNKMRMKRKGYPPVVDVGYRGPREARGVHPSGFREVLVYRPEDLAKVNPETEAIRIASTVGVRKRVEIVREAVRRGIKVLNVDKRTLELLKETEVA